MQVLKYNTNQESLLNFRRHRGRLAIATIPFAVGALLVASASTGTALATVTRPVGDSGIVSRNARASCPGSVMSLTEEDAFELPTAANLRGTYYAKFFADYSTTHPCIKIVREAPATISDAAYLTHLLSQFSTGSQPDLLSIDNPQLDEFAAKGLLVPLTPIKTTVKQMNPANVAEVTYRGQLYGIPVGTSTVAIFYNKRLLAQNGITKLPKTWSQFAADAKRTAHGSDLGFVFSGQAGPGEATWQFDPWSWSNGGTLSTPDSTGSVQALSFLAGLVKVGAAPKEVVNWSQTQPIQEFEAGKAAFCEEGPWDVPGLLKQFPNIKWGVMEIPTRLASQTVKVPLGGYVWVVPKTTPTKEDAALRLLNAISSNPVEQAKVNTILPAISSLWIRPPWNASYYAPFYDELKNGLARTEGLKNPANEPAISLDIGNEIEAALIGKISASQAMRIAQSAIQPLLK